MGTSPFPCMWPDGCPNAEIEGLEYCLHHVPDDCLDEAEQVTGLRRCRLRFGEKRACRQLAEPGTDRCPPHRSGSTSSHAKTSAEAALAVRQAEIMTAYAAQLDSPPPVTNPLQVHLDTLAEAVVLKQVLKTIVSGLFTRDEIRYVHSKAGEQVRQEILLFERALERINAMCVSIERAGIEHRLAAIGERRVTLMEAALTAALNAARIPADRQELARTVLSRELARGDGS